MNDRSTHPRDQSHLYKVTSPNQLAERLQITPAQLEALCRAQDNYIRWVDDKTGRPIQRPKPLLAKVHKRVGILLSRIETPNFLHSAIKGRSYITNASNHSAKHPTVKVDVRKFYPSTRVQAVFHFFRDRMKCEGDVAGMLAKLLTVDGHLATGSSASPILSCFAYEDMFGEIEQQALARGCIMTCYIDDMVFTGGGATRRLIYEVIKVVRRYRLWGHKTKIFKAGQPKVITGVAVTRSGNRLPLKRQKIISDEIAALAAAPNDVSRLALMRQLVSRMCEASQVDYTWRSSAEAMIACRRGLERNLQKTAMPSTGRTPSPIPLKPL